MPRLRSLGFDALLLGLQDLFGDEVAVVELDELLLLVLEGAEASLVVLGLLASYFESSACLFLDLLTNGLDLGGRQLDRAVELLDSSFDGIDRRVVSATADLTPLVADATEVFVDAAVAAMASVKEPSPADAAEQRSLEVVGVLLAAVAGEPVAAEDLLDLLERRVLDYRRVASLALDAFERDHSGVVVVFEHPVDPVAAQRFAGTFARGPGAQTDVLKQITQGRYGVLAGSERIEGDLNEPVAVLIQPN